MAPPKKREEYIGTPPSRREREERAQLRTLGRYEHTIEKKVSSRISKFTAFLMISVALSIDLVEFITTWAGGAGVVLSYITPILAHLCFWFWFKLHDIGIYFDSPKKALTAGGTTSLELILALDAIPIVAFGWTIWVVALIIYTRIEDKTGISLPTSPKKAVTGKIKGVK